MKHCALVVLTFLLLSCDAQQPAPVMEESTPDSTGVAESTTEEPAQEEILPNPIQSTRNTTALAQKIENGEPLVVHVFVPLCDNENQGIVPTSESLGDGMSLTTNLYWATTHGMKRYFKDHSEWELIYEELDPNTNVLERVVFERTLANGTTIYLVEDAYRGDRMAECLADYLQSLAGIAYNELYIDSALSIPIYANADLLAFNGHNGLMDTYIENVYHEQGPVKDAVVIACVSDLNFNWHFENTHSYPLVMTTSLLYPGAAVLDEVITAWANLEDAEACRLAAGQGYQNMKPKYSLEACQRMFSTGW